VASKTKNQIQLKISQTAFKRKRRNRIRMEIDKKIVMTAMMFRGQIMLRIVKKRRINVGKKQKKRKVRKTPNTIIEETRCRKIKNKRSLRRSSQMVKIKLAMKKAKKKVKLHRKMLINLKRTNRRKRNLSKMTKENS
jgi:hypothetical protein